MKSIYITSVERHSGKTATCLALGRRFQADGYTVGYLKPLSLQPWRIGGHIADEDAAFVREILGLSAPAWDLSPVVLTPEFLTQHLTQRADINLLPHVQEAVRTAGEGQDVLLLEGGGSLREGYVVGLPTPAVAEALGSAVIVVISYRDQIRLLDDALAAQVRMQKVLTGILINRVPAGSWDSVLQSAVPFLESHGIRVFGVLPEKRGLEALTVDELIQALHAEVLTPTSNRQALVETLTVGAMTADAALSRFRKQMNKAVITGGDRTDIQLAALETSTACLILTGNLQPSPLIVKQADEFGVSVLLVPTNTMETIEAIENVFGRTRLGQSTKLQQFQDLVAEHVDIERLYQTLGLK